MSKDTYINGTKVTVDHGKTIASYTITGYEKGWYSTKEGKKLRHNQIAHAEAPKAKKSKAVNDTPLAKAMEKHRSLYVETVAASGRKSLNNGDSVATMLAGLKPEEVMEAAEKLLNIKHGELAKLYGHLNAGQQRMNAGNRIRAALRRGEVSEKQIAKAIMG